MEIEKKKQIRELLLGIDVISLFFVILGLWGILKLRHYFAGLFLICFGIFKQFFQIPLRKKFGEMFPKK